ncbi:MAG: hypothetical protein ACK481_01780 [Candidatus Melainabacteria bacterium]|jgi:hypothetical protein
MKELYSKLEYQLTYWLLLALVGQQNSNVKPSIGFAKQISLAYSMCAACNLEVCAPILAIILCIKALLFFVSITNLLATCFFVKQFTIQLANSILNRSDALSALS